MSFFKFSLSSFVAILLGTLLIIASVIALIFNFNNLPENKAKTRGEILEFHVPVSNNKEYNSANLVEFFDTKGNSNTFLYNADNQINYKENKKSKKFEVDVYYNKANPSNAIIYDGYMLLGVPLSVAIIGFFFVVFGFVIRKYEK